MSPVRINLLNAHRLTEMPKRPAIKPARAAASYTGERFDNLVFKMNTRASRALSQKETDRISHPDVPGVEVFSLFSFHTNERRAVRAIWEVNEQKPALVFLHDREVVALLDLARLKSDTLVGFRQDEHHFGLIIKGKLNGADQILIANQAGHHLEQEVDKISSRIKTAGFQPERLIVTSHSPDFKIEKLKEALPDCPVSLLYVHSSVLVGRQGYCMLSVSERCTQTFRWDADGPLPSSRLEKAVKLSPAEAFPLFIEEAVEGILFELASQFGPQSISPEILMRIHEGIAGSKVYQAFKQEFFRDFEGTKDKVSWQKAFTILFAPEVLKVIRPELNDPDPDLTALRHYYYGLCRASRFFDDHWYVRDFLSTIFNELKARGCLSPGEYGFLGAAASHWPSSSMYEGIGDHDEHVCVRGYFSRLSPFPFLFLQHHFDLLSLVGGYQHNPSHPNLRLLHKSGWHGLVIAEHYSNKEVRNDNNLSAYGKNEHLIGRFGYEPFGRIIGTDKEIGKDLVGYLLPAIASQIKSRADLDPSRPDSLVSGYITQYRKLIQICPNAKYSLPSLKGLIASAEDLDPKKKGSLGNMLVRVGKIINSDRFFMIALPGLAQLVESPAELDPRKQGSLADILIRQATPLNQAGWGSERLTWYSLSNILPHLKSKAELCELLEHLPYLKNNQANLKVLLDLIDPKTAENSGLALDEIAGLALDIIKAELPGYSVILEGALAAAPIKSERYRAFRAFITNCRIGLNVRMRILGEFSELLQLEDALCPAKERRSGEIREQLPPEQADEWQGFFQKYVAEVDPILAVIGRLGPTQTAQLKKQQELVSKKMNVLRQHLVAHVIGRPLTENEAAFIKNSRNYERILRLASLTFTIDYGENSPLGKKARILLKLALDKLLSSYDPSKESAEELAVSAMNQWLYSLDRKAVLGIYAEVYGIGAEHLGERIKVAGNQEAREELIKAGYSEELWDRGVDLQVRLTEGLTEEEKRRQILSATFELVEIALMIGIDRIGQEKLTLDHAASLDSYAKAGAFVDQIKDRHLLHDQDREQRLRAILESVHDLESQVILPQSEAQTFRVTIKKDFFTESYSGVGVPGCFNPRGIHREMPFVHGAETNAVFMQAFSPRGAQVANAVIVYTKEGAYVYTGYNSSGYNMDLVFGEALKELSRMAPAVLLSANSAGFNSLKDFSRRKKLEITKSPAIFTDQYFDYGRVEAHQGELTLEDKFYVITAPSIEKKGGFKQRLIIAEKANNYPEINWQALADQFLTPDLNRYPFLAQVTNPRLFLQIIGQVKSLVTAEGRLTIDDNFYAEVQKIIRQRLKETNDDVCDQVTDLIIDFLEAQSWPVEILTAVA